MKYERAILKSFDFPSLAFYRQTSLMTLSSSTSLVRYLQYLFCYYLSLEANFEPLRVCHQIYWWGRGTSKIPLPYNLCINSDYARLGISPPSINLTTKNTPKKYVHDLLSSWCKPQGTDLPHDLRSARNTQLYISDRSYLQYSIL